MCLLLVLSPHQSNPFLTQPFAASLYIIRSVVTFARQAIVRVLSDVGNTFVYINFIVWPISFLEVVQSSERLARCQSVYAKSWV